MTLQKHPAEGRRSPELRICAMLLLLAGLFFASFALGRYGVPLPEVARILWSRAAAPLQALLDRMNFPLSLVPARTWTDNMEIAVVNVRLPRILLACMVGCALSAAGTAYQCVFQNPMAAPDILGASSGACFGAALAILLGRGGAGVTASAFLFSLSTVALVYGIGLRAAGRQAVSILLAGVMVSSLFSAGTSYLKLVADPSSELPEITYWLMGSLSGTKLRDVGFALPPMLAGLVPLLLLRWRMNLLALDEEAKSMGVSVGRLRLIVILCATVLTAASVSVSGMIGWVGLVVPHLCRQLVGNDCRCLLPAAMLLGAAFLLLADGCARNLIATEIPIGILTAFIGAPFFILLMTRKEELL